MQLELFLYRRSKAEISGSSCQPERSQNRNALHRKKTHIQPRLLATATLLLFSFPYQSSMLIRFQLLRYGQVHAQVLIAKLEFLAFFWQSPRSCYEVCTRALLLEPSFAVKLSWLGHDFCLRVCCRLVSHFWTSVFRCHTVYATIKSNRKTSIRARVWIQKMTNGRKPEMQHP